MSRIIVPQLHRLFKAILARALPPSPPAPGYQRTILVNRGDYVVVMGVASGSH